MFFIGWLYPIAIIGAIIWAIIDSHSKKPNLPPTDTGRMLDEHNRQWITFIETYDKVAKTAAEKQFLRRILYDAANLGLGTSALAGEFKLPKGQKTVAVPVTAETATIQPAYPAEFNQSWEAPQMPAVEPRAASKPIDNTSLLLYFGAFLFVASVGLFVTFGGASGSLRAFAVLLVMAVMYSGGQWLYHSKPRLQQAGLAFVGIGIVIAPLIGLAVYNYVAAKEHAPLIWLLTSALCLVLYTHALVTLKKPLISYVLIFTFLSLFESGVSVINAPIYYFGWGLALVGIILQLLSRWTGYYAELKESSRQSSLVLLPIALFASLIMVRQQGIGQFGISLLLTAAFYGLEALNTSGREQEADAVVSQAATMAAAGCLAYATHARWEVVVTTLLVVNLVQIVLMLLFKVSGQLWHNFGSVLLTGAIVDVLFAAVRPHSLLASVIGLLVVGVALWWRQRRADAYGAAAVSLMAVPYIAGQITLSQHLSAAQQTVWAFTALLLLIGAYRFASTSDGQDTEWQVSAAATYVVGAISVTAASFFASPSVCLATGIGLALATLVLLWIDKRPLWADIAGIFLALPIIRDWSNPKLELVSMLIALIGMIVLSLRYHREFLRWASTLIWLLLPIGLGRGALGTNWNATEYAWAYVAVMAALLISRAIARGVLFFSSKTPLGAYARSASFSYVFGYVGAAVLAVVVSFWSDNTRLHTTAILGLLMLATLLISLRIEKRREFLVFLPLLAQGALSSALHPSWNGHDMAYLLSSTALAVVSYAAVPTAEMKKKGKGNVPELMRQTAIATAFITPGLVIGLVIGLGSNGWPMPFGLLVAGVLLCHYVRNSNQANRELAGSLVTISLLWFLGVWHVGAFQAYVHVVIANLALYAYWRAVRGEREASDSYIWAMLSTATVPLAIQAMSGAAGGLYGWWLLLEQIVFMLLGMTIKRRFVTLWGLYVAVAAVLFQLRHLGWAALTVLALFLIGLAIYQLQKHSDQS